MEMNLTLIKTILLMNQSKFYISIHLIFFLFFIEVLLDSYLYNNFICIHNILYIL